VSKEHRDMSNEGKTISREELYQKIWTTPIVRLAEELGYSYSELIKICVGLGIPRPIGGYWNRLQHGGASEQVPLPPASPGVKTEIPLGPRLNAPLPPEPPTYAGEEGKPSDAAQVATTKDVSPKTNATEVDVTSTPEKPDSTAKKIPKPLAPERIAPIFPDVVEMTREELYEHVWQTPIHLLAEALGLSDVGLAKTCAQMEVPKPGRGYWARLAAGEKLKRIQLPAPSSRAVRCWTFNVVLNRRRRADWAASNLITARKSKPSPRIELPNEQEPLHEIGERHRAAIEKAKPDQQGFVHLHLQSLFRCDVSPAVVHKLLRAVHAFVTAVEQRGWQLARGDAEHSHLSIVHGQDRLTVQWRESIAVVEREPTMEEKRKPSWTWQLKENKPTGQLTVEVTAIGLKGTRSWTESESKPIEDVLARVVEKIEATFEGFEAQRKREEEWAHQREQEAKRRAEILAEQRELEAQREKERQQRERRAKHEQKLVEIAEERRENLAIATQWWIESEQMLAFVAACERRWRDDLDGKLTEEQRAWIAWARTKALERSPWTVAYPNPDKDGAFDPGLVPIGGPYPKTVLLESKQVEQPEPGKAPPLTPAYVPPPPPDPYPYWLLHRRR
jgi:hypothetical protein